MLPQGHMKGKQILKKSDRPTDPIFFDHCSTTKQLFFVWPYGEIISLRQHEPIQESVIVILITASYIHCVSKKHLDHNLFIFIVNFQHDVHSLETVRWSADENKLQHQRCNQGRVHIDLYFNPQSVCIYSTSYSICFLFTYRLIHIVLRSHTYNFNPHWFPNSTGK